MWWKQNKWKVIIPALVVVALAFAFWYGGGAPGSQGWRPVGPSGTAEAAPSAALPSSEPSPSAAAPAGTPAPETAASTEPSASPSAPAPSAQAPSASTAPSAPPSSAAPSAAAPTATASATPTPVTPATVPPTATPTPAPSPSEPAGPGCTLSISCANLLEHLDELGEDKAALVPQDGWLLAPTQVTFEEGESAFDVLRRVCREKSIHLEFSETPAYGSVYVEGIGNLYEQDCGELSGWLYLVNGKSLNYSASQYLLEDGDQVFWGYTLDLGADLGVGVTGT